ncbi:hypothetical protein L861_02470 [Litchfieldella anticariensis FP35 = DSM 16096]|uniref:Uncharacterized protein n=1 Tax=Litchfieldella anticariensis (strain DSM 16096 / CECT 5854 / CIP 108499 / LMG 22089 / FP35) TaxID=1121939 RepID=S2KQ37_LITA3|nr:hypothetical protein [Halomonas anticariensis]EPC04197.1 hypothetical protein L861_02470 [Halomonas anticariensis FP35 = DSM 16096]
MTREARLAVGNHTCPADLHGRRCHVMVSTPLQYLNAKELVELLGSRERYLVILEQHYRHRDFVDLPGIANWTRIDTVKAGRLLPHVRLSPLLRCLADVLADVATHRRIAQMLIRWPTSELLVIGNPNEVLHLDFASQGGGQELLICDDGTSTLSGFADRSRSKWLRRRLLGIRRTLLDNAWQFTAYADVRPGTRTLHNTYDYLRSYVMKRSPGGGAARDIWFLGQPLVEFGVTSLSAYLELVQSIRSGAYAEQRVLYWPHPRECRDNLARLASATGMEVVSRSGPIELELVRQPLPPARVATLYSSAYQSCYAIFGDAVAFDVFEPHQDYWQSGHSEVRIMRDCYAYFRSHVRPPHRFFRQENTHDWQCCAPFLGMSGESDATPVLDDAGYPPARGET